MGSGKTLVGALVAQRTRSAFFDLDHLVEDRAGLSVAEIFATHSEEAFRGLLQPGAVVALGGGVVMDDENWRLIAEHATTVYLEVPFETIWQRIHHLPGRPLIANRTASEVEELFERRRARYEQADHTVDGTREPGVVADEVLELWSD